jgi:hypothetical protein
MERTPYHQDGRQRKPHQKNSQRKCRLRAARAAWDHGSMQLQIGEVVAGRGLHLATAQLDADDLKTIHSQPITVLPCDEKRFDRPLIPVAILVNLCDGGGLVASV